MGMTPKAINVRILYGYRIWEICYSIHTLKPAENNCLSPIPVKKSQEVFTNHCWYLLVIPWLMTIIKGLHDIYHLQGNLVV